jgi:hypothetical protein
MATAGRAGHPPRRSLTAAGTAVAYASHMPVQTLALQPGVGVQSCIFCGTTQHPLTCEHVIPKWARRSFNIKGPVTLDAREEGSGQRRRVGAMQALNITLHDAICEECNSVWLSRLERAAKPLLAPMAVSAKPTLLSPANQKFIAAWAVKTVLLLELAFRQMYPAIRPTEGYEASQAELAWLRAKTEPPPRSRVWLGCRDCQQAMPVRYAPSSAPLPTPDGTQVEGHLATFTLGYAALQVFTVDYVTAEQDHAAQWNDHVPASLAQALPRIWPPLATQQDLLWPLHAFAANDWDRLVTWDGALRPGTDGG